MCDIDLSGVDLGEYGQPYTTAKELAAFIRLPENDDADYVQFREYLSKSVDLGSPSGVKLVTEARNLMRARGGELWTRIRAITDKRVANDSLKTCAAIFYEHRLATSKYKPRLVNLDDEDDDSLYGTIGWTA